MNHKENALLMDKAVSFRSDLSIKRTENLYKDYKVGWFKFEYGEKPNRDQIWIIISDSPTISERCEWFFSEYMFKMVIYDIFLLLFHVDT